MLIKFLNNSFLQTKFTYVQKVNQFPEFIWRVVILKT